MKTIYSYEKKLLSGSCIPRVLIKLYKYEGVVSVITMKSRFIRHLAVVVCLSLGAVSGAQASECIAPADAGGGWDFTCRQISKIMYDIGAVDSPIQVTNMAGSGGGAAFKYVVAERNDDADLIVAASSATSTRLAQNAYAGMTADQVRFVGAIGADPGVIVVAANSPYQSLTDLVNAIKRRPALVALGGGSAVGGFDHLKPLMILNRAGFKDVTRMKYISLNNGGNAIAQTMNGYVQAMSGDMSEIAALLRSGDVRVLAVLTEERVPGFEDIPTAKEQGFDVVAVNWRGLYVPKGVSDDTFNMWADRLMRVAQSDEWKAAMAEHGLVPFTKVGNDFQNYIDQVVDEVRIMSKQLGVIR